MRVPFDFTITTSGAPTPSLSETGNLPNGLTFTDNGDGTADISGIAVAGTAGTYPLTISADNGIGDPVTQSFVLTVTTATSPPTITSPPTDTETVGVPFSFTVTTNGYPAAQAHQDRIAAIRGRLHRQRRRHGHDRRDCERLGRRQLSPDNHREEFGRHDDAGLHAHHHQGPGA